MKTIILFVLSTVFCPFPVLAQTLTLEQAIRTTWENSPQLKAQKELAGIYSDDTWRRFIPQEPTGSWAVNYSAYGQDAIEPVWGLSLTYPIPFKSLAFTQLDSAVAQQQRWEMTAKKYDLAVAIAQAYMNGATAQAMIVFQEQNVQDLETITEAIRLQYIHGHSNQTQKISAELQLAQAQRDLKTAQDQLETAVELYARLMGIPPGQVTGFELPEDVPSSIIKELGDRTSGQLRDKASMDVGEANRATGFWAQIPDPTFSISQDNYQDLAISPWGGKQDYNYMVSFTIPILFPFHEVAEAKRSENQGIISKDTARIQLIQDNSAQEAGALDYRRSRDRFKRLHSKDLILAEAMKESALAAYKRGQLAFSDLMLARQTYASLKIEDIQIRAEIVNSHLAGLRDIEGSEENDKTEFTSQPIPAPTPHRLLGANNPLEDGKPQTENESVTPTPEVGGSSISTDSINVPTTGDSLKETK
jgi:outer membrane protein TolC